jgi:threonine/homoserine/homoserine lactone efflux protein
MPQYPTPRLTTCPLTTKFGVVSIEFWITTLVVVATPGTGALYTIAAGLSRGARASIVAAFACTIGIIPHMVAAITGLAALLHTSAVAFNVVKYLGVAYLIYLAVMTWRDRSSLVADEKATPLSARRVIVTGVLINLLNPKLTIFFFAFLPLFVNSGRPDTLPLMLLLSGIFMAATFVVFALYGLFAAGFRTHVIRRPRVVTWMRRSFAAAYIVLAARLAIPERL